MTIDHDESIEYQKLGNRRCYITAIAYDQNKMIHRNGGILADETGVVLFSEADDIWEMDFIVQKRPYAKAITKKILLYKCNQQHNLDVIITGILTRFNNCVMF